MNLPPDFDIYSAGRVALAKAHALFGGRAFFSSTRWLQQDGSWSGPQDAVCWLADEEAVSALGGFPAAEQAGANAILCNLDGALAGQAVASGLRCLVRVPFAEGESADERRDLLERMRDLTSRMSGIDGVMPMPSAEPQGLHTLAFFAECRQALGQGHLVVDLERFGHKLGQLCLSFGADEILGPILLQRGLRLGERASSHELTRDEAVLLLRAAGFSPCERLPDGKVLSL
jgi:hypothetical protein